MAAVSEQRLPEEVAEQPAPQPDAGVAEQPAPQPEAEVAPQSAPQPKAAAVGMEEPARPRNAYWIWLTETRQELVKELPSGSSASVVGKLAGERWKALSGEEKAPFQQKAAEAKAAYEKAMDEFRAQGGIPGKRQQAKAEQKKGKADTKKSKAEAKKRKDETHDPNRPSPPQTAYWLWLGENREALTKEVGNSKITEVSKLAGERWKALAAESKAPFEKKSAELKAAYVQAMEDYKKSDVYVAALEKQKEAGAKAKYEQARAEVGKFSKKMSQFEKSKLKAKQLARAAKEEYDKVKTTATPKKAAATKQPKLTPTKDAKRARTAEPANTPTKDAKRARTAEPANTGVYLEAELLADAGDLAVALKNLAIRPEMGTKTGKEMLEVLRACGGLVNKAKATLLGA